MKVFRDEGMRVPVKAWTDKVPDIEESALQQLRNVASLPFIHHHVVVMPDVHWGMGATVGSVIPTRGAIIPAAVGVDIGCGMVAACTSLKADDLPESLGELRSAVEAAVPHGRTNNGKGGDKGAWTDPPASVAQSWSSLAADYQRIVGKHPKAKSFRDPVVHLGTLGTGNHFIELCLDEAQRVWVMVHSGSRGVGNRIGSYFIELAKNDMRKLSVNLPDANLAYLTEGTQHFEDYVEAVTWAQAYAASNRTEILNAVLRVLKARWPEMTTTIEAVNCHHNYVALETHFGAEVYVTRKGAVRARTGDLGIIPGSMGTRSYIVRGKSNPESFNSCSHGAGRRMSRGEAKKRFTVQDHVTATAGVECRKDPAVLDETPGAYKDIDSVMASQADLVEVLHTLKQVVCVKG